MVHIESWPKRLRSGNVGKAQAAELATLVEMVRSLALSQIEYGLPTLMVQCENGLDLSCTFAAIYISRQLYLRFNAVNVKFVLQLLARTRLGAYESDDSFDHIQVLHAIVSEMIKKYPRPAKGKRFSAFSAIRSRFLSVSPFQEPIRPWPSKKPTSI